LLDRFCKQRVSRRFLGNPRLLLRRARGPVRNDKPPHEERGRQQGANNEEPSSQLCARVSPRRFCYRRFSDPDRSEQLEKSDRATKGDKQKDDEKNPIKNRNDSLWRLGDPLPLEEIPAPRLAVIASVFPLAHERCPALQIPVAA